MVKNNNYQVILISYITYKYPTYEEHVGSAHYSAI